MSFRGKALRVEGVEGATPLSSLKEKLQELTAVPTANQKLVRVRSLSNCSACCTSCFLCVFPLAFMSYCATCWVRFIAAVVSVDCDTIISQASRRDACSLRAVLRRRSGVVYSLELYE